MVSRVYLRPFNLADAPTLLKWGQDEYYQRLAGFGHYQNLAEAEVAAGQYAARKYSYGICLSNSRQLIGLVELYNRGTNEEELLHTKEVGFLLDKDFSGHGYMTESLKILFDYAFKKLDQSEIWAGTYQNNTRSQNLLARLGFKLVYSVDMSKVSSLFEYQEDFFLLKKSGWLDLEQKLKF